MKKKIGVICLLVTAFIFSWTSIAAACTIFTISDGGLVFFGNNEDYTNPNTYYWVEPSQEGRYGAVYFGFDNFWPQGGINEKGLAFDINSLPDTPLEPRPELPSFDTYEGYSILRNCATVEEAIEHVQGFNWGPVMGGQIHVADAGGDAVVIGPGLDGNLSFTRKSPGDGFLISTNFNLAEPDEREDRCDRYDIAAEMLAKAGKEKRISVDYIKEILDASHTEGAYVNTLYSTIYNLKSRRVYIYYSHQFDEVVELQVDTEITEIKNPVLLSSLFSESIIKNAAREKSAYLFREILKTVLEILGVIIALVFLFFVVRNWRRRRAKSRIQL